MFFLLQPSFSSRIYSMTFFINTRWKTIFLFFLTFNPLLNADEPVRLQYIQIEGQVLHADALVDETVYIDGLFNHQAEIDEFSVSVVREITSEGSAVLDSSFRVIERVDSVPGYFEWISDETVRLERTSQGFMSVPEDASLPVLRNVPSFPDYSVKPGDSWSLPAEEVHVFRIRNVLYGPYRGSVQVLYKYLENKIIENHTFARISIDYNVYLPVRQRGEPIRLISGISHQEILWDIEYGRPELKIEDFEFLMMMTDGRTQEFIGTGRTTYRLSESINRTLALETLHSELESVPGVTIKSTEEGILLSIVETENILFEPESSIVSDNQKYRLEELARSLKAYTDRDILVTGHTADYGTPEGRKNLSMKRAAAVSDILFPEGRTGQGRLFLRGAGNTELIGSDQLNRRVEILILD